MSKVLILIGTFLFSTFLAIGLVLSLPGHFDQDETKVTVRSSGDNSENQTSSEQTSTNKTGSRYQDWLKSWDYPDQSISSLVIGNLGYSLILQSVSFLLVMMFSFALSLLALQSRVFDKILEKVLTIGISAPTLFWIPVLVYFLSLKLDVFPLRFEPTFIGWMLPLVSLSIRPLCLATEILLAEWKQAEVQSYFLVARSKGLSRTSVFLKHGLKNALIPFSAQMGNFLVQSIIGSVLVESLFSFPGIGLLFVQSLQNRDLPVVLVLTLVFTLIMMLVHAIVEVFQNWLEPRSQQELA